MCGACARRALNSCSHDQAASPKSRKPSMRELPFRVWKARRTVVMSCALSAALCSRSIAAPASLMTSRASSTKMSRISGSSSSPVPPCGAGLGGGTTASGVPASGAEPDKLATASASSARNSRRACGSALSRRPALARASRRPSSGWSAARACWARRSASCASVVSLTEACAAAMPSARIWSSKGACCGAEGSPPAGSSSSWAKAETRSDWPITALKLPVSGSKRNSDLASCGCTLSMSIRKLKAPRLLARRSKVPAWMARWGSTSVCASASTSSRMCSAACEAWSMPSTDNTPRIDDSWAGTGISTWRSAGLRK